MQRRIRELGTRIDQVLAVVEEHQRALGTQVVDERREQRTARLLPHAYCRGEDLRHEYGIGDRCELKEPHATWILLEETSRHLKRQSRLAVPAGPGDRQQMRLGQQALDLDDLPLTSDKGW
jgi:hypothetical protein